ncbi:MAG: glycosyltransferase family 2 protein [Candidatus Doudnabacteria bacterium]|nr:glycosyltransferase family 2 protein [Candidatus Doudnabacteria bacterium]
MKISFVIPAYNEERYLPKCLESIIKETNKHSDIQSEIIVVNNASTDRTKDIALNFTTVKVVDEPKKGLVFARAAGAEKATGDLIAHIDADCMLPPGWLEKATKNFTENKSLVALSGPYVYYDFSPFQNLLVKTYYSLATLPNFAIKIFSKNSSILQGGNIVVKTQAWKKMAPPSPGINFYGEDTDLASRLSKIGEIKFDPNFTNTTSGRRLLNEGILKTAYKYIMNFLFVLFLKRPFTKKYTDIRPH